MASINSIKTSLSFTLSDGAALSIISYVYLAGTFVRISFSRISSNTFIYDLDGGGTDFFFSSLLISSYLFLYSRSLAGRKGETYP